MIMTFAGVFISGMLVGIALGLLGALIYIVESVKKIEREESEERTQELLDDAGYPSGGK